MIDARVVLAEIILARGEIRTGRMREARARIERVRALLPPLDQVEDTAWRTTIRNLTEAVDKLDGILHNLSTNPYTPKRWRPSQN